MKILILILTLFSLYSGKSFAATGGLEEYTLIDVRTPDEYSESHIKGALNIDIKSSSFEEGITKLDKNKSYKLYCRSGNRSGKAIELMKSKGFLHLENLGGLSDAITKVKGTCEGKGSCQ